MPKFGGTGSLGRFGGFGCGSDEDSDSDDHSDCGSCFGERRTYCEMCGNKDYCDPHNGLCGDCAEDTRPPGGCPCWRQTCQYFDEYDMFECEC